MAQSSHGVERRGYSATVPADGASEQLGAGDSLGPYRIESLLGEGGMGQVFRATDTGTGAVVALKVIKPEHTDEEHARRFAHEARAAGEVSHRNLVGVTGSGEAGGRRYLAMRYVDGPSVAQQIEAHGPLSIEATARLARHVAAGLDALHAAGLVHRDVKPSNIMLDSDGVAALTDFGLAKGSDYSALTAAGQAIGTIDYMAPELIRGEPPTTASDVYSLGCVVYECLAGKPPFGGRGMLQVGLGHLEETPADPCAGRPEAPEHLGAAVLTALEKQPEARPRTPTAYGRLIAVATRVAPG
jgi:serine/threonine-protein kinase